MKVTNLWLIFTRKACWKDVCYALYYRELSMTCFFCCSLLSTVLVQNGPSLLNWLALCEDFFRL